jgi:hypothetical protein
MMRLLSPPAGAPGRSAAAQRRSAALERARQLVEARFAPAFVVLAGSERTGSAGPDSDIDLLVISRKPLTQRLRWRILGVRVDVFVQTAQSIAARARAGTSAHIIEMCASGRVLGGDERLYRVLRDAAREALQRCDSPSDRLRFRFACAPFDLLRDLARTSSNETGRKALLVNALVDVLIDAAFAKQGVVKPKRRDLFGALALMDAAGAALLERIFASPARELELPQLVEAVRHFVGDEPCVPELATPSVPFPPKT